MIASTALGLCNPIEAWNMGPGRKASDLHGTGDVCCVVKIRFAALGQSRRIQGYR